jgi:hypothetical protein
MLEGSGGAMPAGCKTKRLSFDPLACSPLPVTGSSILYKWGPLKEEHRSVNLTTHPETLDGKCCHDFGVAESKND